MNKQIKRGMGIIVLAGMIGSIVGPIMSASANKPTNSDVVTGQESVTTVEQILPLGGAASFLEECVEETVAQYNSDYIEELELRILELEEENQQLAEENETLKK